MNKMCLLALSVMIPAVMSSCQSANADTLTNDETRETRTESVSNFSGIDVANGIAVTYTQSDRVEATVDARADILPYVKVVQKGEMLNIYLEHGKKHAITTGKILVTLTSPMLNTYRLSSGAVVKVKGTLNLGNRKCDVNISSGAVADFAAVTGGEFYIDASSGGVVDIDNLSVGKVQADASSGAVLDLDGKVTTVVLTSSSGAVVDAEGLQADEGVANASSGSILKCNVTGKFSSSNSSAATLTNKGR